MLNLSKLVEVLDIPPWLSTLLFIVGSGLMVHAGQPLESFKGSSHVEVGSYIPHVQEPDLHTILRETDGDAISVWSINYFVPESASMHQTINTTFNVAHINTYKVSLTTFSPQIAAHTAQQCYVGEPLIEGYREAGITHTINCPITYEVIKGRKMMIGFVSVMYSDEPTDIQSKLSKLNTLNQKVTINKE